MQNKYFQVLGHPSGRMLLTREPYQVNLNQLIEAAAEHQVAMEINANPQRLDLDWRYCHQAKKLGVKFVIGLDAHRLGMIEVLRYGVGIARKGWLTKDDILNTLALEDFQRSIRRSK
jgi:DNA polymerase (family 10)